MSCHICIYWTPLNGCTHYKPAIKSRVKFYFDKDSTTVFAYFLTTKMSYSHVGQHSGCSIEYLKQCTPAIGKDYKDLERELTSLGYNLDILSPNTPIF